MKLHRAIVSTNNNPDYYKCWPLVAKAWKNLGIQPTICIIGDVDIDHSLGDVINFPEIEGISSSFIAQVIRFLIPLLYPHEVSIIGDIDMIPLSRDYFNNNVSRISEEDFVVYSSDAYENVIRYPMCYLVGKGELFSEIIGINEFNETEYINIIKYLHSLNLGWDTDELFFSEKLNRWKKSNNRNVHFLKRGWTNNIANKRIDRADWSINIDLLKKDFYIDAHLPRNLTKTYKKIKPVEKYVNYGNNGALYKKEIFEKKIVSTLLKFFKITR